MNSSKLPYSRRRHIPFFQLCHRVLKRLRFFSGLVTCCVLDVDRALYAWSIPGCLANISDDVKQKMKRRNSNSKRTTDQSLCPPLCPSAYVSTYLPVRPSVWMVDDLSLCINMCVHVSMYACCDVHFTEALVIIIVRCIVIIFVTQNSFLRVSFLYPFRSSPAQTIPRRYSTRCAPVLFWSMLLQWPTATLWASGSSCDNDVMSSRRVELFGQI